MRNKENVLYFVFAHFKIILIEIGLNNKQYCMSHRRGHSTMYKLFLFVGLMVVVFFFFLLAETLSHLYICILRVAYHTLNSFEIQQIITSLL